jgi:CMP-N-acetylneuraminic acid synthetase/spore coat polysaccharide biosynthesis predicted glycosyltransferase SpsG
MNIVAVIPARGGSKGIPRKNLRPMAGNPLIFYSINACLNAKSISKVIVTTDDDEIALFASRFGAEVIMRPAELGADHITLDPVILHAVESSSFGDDVDVVVTVQPTSPLITSDDIDGAMACFNDESCDTVLSVVDDRHLCWALSNGKATPNYSERVNRQQLPSNYKETGAVIACRKSVLKTGTRIGSSIQLHEVEHENSFDIDTLSDFYLCESLLGRKKIVFYVAGNSSIGLGHAYRTVMLANELVLNEIVFVVTEEDDLAKQYIEQSNYPVITTTAKKASQTIIDLQPNLVINDVLDTDVEYMRAISLSGIRTVNFEDMGPGIDEADLVINALYPTSFPSKHVLSGAEYFCLRDEFLYIDVPPTKKDVEKVLLCFGGVDEGDLSRRALAAIAPKCAKDGIAITIVLGLGYGFSKELTEYANSLELNDVTIVQGTSRMSDFMVDADLAITSGGRTVFELASLNVPTLVICQNERELTHKFASSDNGVINLGHRDSVKEEQITSTFLSVVMNKDMRELMLEKASKIDLSSGKKRVINLIENLMGK